MIERLPGPNGDASAAGREYAVPSGKRRRGWERIDKLDRRILEELSNGARDAEIGAMLGMAENNVGHRVGRIMDKMGADTRTHAVAIALRKGLIE